MFGFTPDRIDACWEEASEGYTGSEYAPLAEEIVDSLVHRDFLAPGCSVLDIGCGTGSFDLLMAPIAGGVFGVDGSRGMLDRLKERCCEHGIGNIRTRLSRWEDFDTAERFDLVFSSLCPALNDPESILRMETYSKGWCAYVSSIGRDEGIGIEVFERIGHPVSFRGFDTRYPYEVLRALGRNPDIEVFSRTTRRACSEGEMVRLQEKEVGRYLEVTPDISETIVEVVSEHSRDGVVETDRTMTLGLLTWLPDRDGRDHHDSRGGSVDE